MSYPVNVFDGESADYTAASLRQRAEHALLFDPVVAAKAEIVVRTIRVLDGSLHDHALYNVRLAAAIALVVPEL